MERIFPLFFVALIIILIAAGIISAALSSRRRQDLWKQVAAQFDTRCYASGMFGHPSLRFHHRGAAVLADVHSTGGKRKTYYTQVHITFPDSQIRVEVYPEGFFHRLGKLVGMRDILIGSPAFDERYIITGSSPDDVRGFLSGDVQHSVEQLRRIWQTDEVYVSVVRGNLLVKKRGKARSAIQLSQLIQLSVTLFDQALGTQLTGIEFVESAETNSAADDIICQICGDAITSDVVHCRSCRTPHHRDCWQYYGACSTYGCGEKRCSVPRKR